MNRRRRRRHRLQRLCVYAIVAMSLTVTGASSSSPGGPPLCVLATATDACVTRSTTELVPDGGTRQNVGAPHAFSAAPSLAQGRGKKKKKKNTAMNMIFGGGMMAVFVMVFMFLNMITVTLGKAFLFTFITKFLVSVNWKSSSSKEKSSNKDVTVVMT